MTLTKEMREATAKDLAFLDNIIKHEQESPLRSVTHCEYEAMQRISALVRTLLDAPDEGEAGLICGEFRQARLHGQQKYGGDNPAKNDLRRTPDEWIKYIRDHLQRAELSGNGSMDQRDHFVKCGGLILSAIWNVDHKSKGITNER